MVGCLVRNSQSRDHGAIADCQPGTVCPAMAITIESDMRADGSRGTTRYDID
jgi:hypothetical protein